MAYFSLLYESEQAEQSIKTKSRNQLFTSLHPEIEREYEFIGSKMVLSTKNTVKNDIKCPAFFKDLNMDQVIKKIIIDDSDTELMSIFYDFLLDYDTIIYRHDIFKDLDNIDIYNSIQNYQSSIYTVYRLIQHEKEANHPLQKNKYILDALVLYQTSILTIISRLSCFTLSDGMRKLVATLTEYSTSHSFLELRKKSLSLLERIESIYYTLTVSPDKILVNFNKKEFDFNEYIKSLFKSNQNTGTDISFFRQLYLSDLELRIAGIIYKKEKELFLECEQFINSINQLISPLTTKIHNELKFYVACHDFFTAMKVKNYIFTYPVILDEKKIQIKGLYDISLALKSCNSSEVITNDFELTSEESGAWITGANQGGKTTFARSIAQIIYMAQLGLPVPASNVNFPLFNGILTHFPSEENVKTRNGKLKEELLHIKEILNYIRTGNCFLILNEPFSSTTTADAYDMCNLLIDTLLRNNSTVICVTHIPKLAHNRHGMISLGTDIVNNADHSRTYRIIPKEAASTSYAYDIANKYQLTYQQIKERIGNEH